MVGAQGTLYASLFPARIRYTGLSTVYQLSGVYASGLTPLILTALIGAAGGTPWIACGYLVVTAVLVARLLADTLGKTALAYVLSVVLGVGRASRDGPGHRLRESPVT